MKQSYQGAMNGKSSAYASQGSELDPQQPPKKQVKK